ncbi:transglutaminase-like domain-containing protein [Xenorhabdus bharatensis]|uniref:transglutaminase-like domain-containing protein n=1 Tax=Xenorhabdus bharatensis TaxID=3136256 RepID=UPI0030F442A5
MKRYLSSTPLLDFYAENIQQLITEKGWINLTQTEKIKAVYNFVKDDIAFGFNEDDLLTASNILQAGYGQCNTKSTLFMALLRALGLPCRLHGFTIDKSLQYGIMQGKIYEMVPQEIYHTWVEVYINGQWLNFEGIILDKSYLTSLQKKHATHKGKFVGYGVAIDDLANAPIEWYGDNNTYIQREGIVQDLGLFDSPDDFFSKYEQKMTLQEKEIFANKIRHEINRNINHIRDS